MKIIISPAKQMKTEADIVKAEGIPFFLDRAMQIHDTLKKLSFSELKTLLKANDNIVKLNYERYQTIPLGRAYTPALLAYIGLQYQYMSPQIFSDMQWDYVNRHLCILSGLYGLLGASDKVVPYRLEMQAKLTLNGTKNLYEYWDRAIYERIAEGEDTILNLASKEYSKVVEPYLNKKMRYVTCIFGHRIDGRVKVKATDAKIARGEMVAWLARHQIGKVEEVKGFRGNGFIFDKEESQTDIFVFIKREQIKEEICN